MGTGTGQIRKREEILIFHRFVIIIKRSFAFRRLAHCWFAGGKVRDSGRGSSHGDSQQEISSTYEA